MNIKDYLENQLKLAENSESLSAKGKDIYGEGFAEGRKFAIEGMITAFPRLEHELTLRELKEFCENTGCDYCPFASSVTNNHGELKYISCTIVKTPHHFKINDITQKVREARK